MAIPSFKYKNKKWDVNLPSIRAYVFDKKDVDEFMELGTFPIDFDTNMLGGCNANCKYCATQGGKSDVRFKHNETFQKISDKNIIEMIKQLNIMGTKTFFLCGIGEPLLNPERFLKIIDESGDLDINIITYTNGLNLDKTFLRELHKRKINLVMKLESLNPELNNQIILGDKNKNSISYNYGKLNNRNVSSGIIDAFEIYGSDSDCLGIETMILKSNFDEILEIREWIYGLNTAQFLKKLYSLGYAKLRGEDVLLDKYKEKTLTKEIIDFDSKYGFTYPSFKTPDDFSFDVRRFMNNCVSNNGFPFRMFTHEIGGVYQSSQIVPIKFGFGTNNIISVFDKNGKINVREYFNTIRDCLKNE